MIFLVPAMRMFENSDLTFRETISLCMTLTVPPHGAGNQPKYLNAFHILSLSAGLDLSVFFASNNDDEIEDTKFTSKSSASSII
jgi:hypothetical protein